MIRRPYTTKFRPFRDSDEEVDIVWYPAKKDAPVLSVPSVVCSLDWWVQERDIGIYHGFEVGEVPGAKRSYNSQKVHPDADGLKFCGTEDDFANGAAFDPNVRRFRRTDGLPTCCGGVPPGVVIGGRAGPPPLNPGVVVGGSAQQIAGVQSGRGSFVVGGHAEVSRCCFNTLVEHPDLLVHIPDGPRSAGSPFLAAWNAMAFAWRFTDGSGETLNLFCQSGHWFVTTLSFGFIGDSIAFSCTPLAVLMSSGFGSSGSVTITRAP